MTERKKHIAAFFQHMPPYSGAAGLRGKSIFESLPKHVPDSKITVYCSNPEADGISGVEVVPLSITEVENSLRLRLRLLGEALMGLAAARKMLLGWVRPDLVIISSPAYLSAIVLVFIARLRGVPYVLEMRDIYPQVYAAAGLVNDRNPFYKFSRWLSRSVYRHAKIVICPTKGVARSVAEETPKANILQVYNGFPSSLVGRSAIKYDRFTVCFHGVLGFFQDVDTLVKVSRRLVSEDIDVVAIGYGRKQASLDELELENFRFLGKQTFERTIEEIEKCHFGLSLRLDDDISKDAFPVKVWEYLALSIPTIITPPSEAGDFVTEHKCGHTVGSGDVDRIVELILDAKNDRVRLNVMAKNCQSVADKYTREQTGADISAAIAKLFHDGTLE